jgi:hypothetical protein
VVLRYRHHAVHALNACGNGRIQTKRNDLCDPYASVQGCRFDDDGDDSDVGSGVLESEGAVKSPPVSKQTSNDEGREDNV